MTVTTLADLSHLHGAVRHQGDRPTCLAFTLSDLNMHRHGQMIPFSPEYLYREAARNMVGWKPGDGLELTAALTAVYAPGQPLEVDCPYLPEEPQTPLAPSPTFSRLFTGSYAHFHPKHDEIVEVLERGQSVGLVLKLTPEFVTVDMPSGKIVYSAGHLPGMSHAVLAVGHGVDAQTNEPHLLIRNSWGAGWGMQGHAWLPQEYLVSHAILAFGA